MNPICGTYLDPSSRSALHAAKEGERGKVNKFADLVNRLGAEFIGLGFETTGAMGPGALTLVKRLSARADERSDEALDADLCTWTARQWGTRFRQLLSLAVVSGVARAVIEGASRLRDRVCPPTPASIRPFQLPPIFAALQLAHAQHGAAVAAAPATGPSAAAQHPQAVGDDGSVSGRQVQLAGAAVAAVAVGPSVAARHLGVVGGSGSVRGPRSNTPALPLLRPRPP